MTFTTRSSIFIIIGFTILAYLPVSMSDFTNWDDNVLIIENEKLQNGGFEDLLSIMFHQKNMHAKPVTYFSWWLEIQLFGGGPFSFHVINLLLHCMNAVLLFLILRLWSFPMKHALFGALLFALIPSHVESVAWISERKDVLFTAFYLLAILCWSHFIKDHKRNSVFLLLSLLAAILSVGSKLMAISIPFILLLLAIKQKHKNGIFISAIFSLAIICVPLFVLDGSSKLMNQMISPLEGGLPYSFTEGFLISIYQWGFYVFRTLWPFGLQVIYPYPEDLVFYGTIVFTLAIFFFIALSYFQKMTNYLDGILFYTITIIPALYLFLPFGYTVAGDRFTYLSSIGIILILLQLLKWPIWDRIEKRAKLSFGLVILGVLGFQTFTRAQIWKNSETLWTAALEEVPSSKYALKNLSAYYIGQGEHAKALALNSEGIKDPDVINNLAIAAYEKGDGAAAIRLFDEALLIDKKNFKTGINKAMVQYQLGDALGAIGSLTKLTSWYPNEVRPIKVLGSMMMELERYLEADSLLSRSLAMDSNDTEIFQYLGYTKAQLGMKREALDLLDHALKLDPQNGFAHWNKSVIYFESENWELAYEHALNARRGGYSVSDGALSRMARKAKANDQ